MELSFSSFEGIIIGFVTFLVIGLFHPLVIKAEYYFGVGSWWCFALLGICCMISSIYVDNHIISICLGVIAFSSFWSIHELFQQRERVKKGWFPSNPKREKK